MSRNDVNQPEFWEEVYLNNLAGWDLGGPTPVFEELSKSPEITSGSMIVIGAGRGYDARSFASKGFEVVAVDFAEQAVEDMQRLSQPEAPFTILQADIFDLPKEFLNKFDYVLEYTCYCAIDPGRREEYGEVIRDLLKPGGRYIALAFPIGNYPGGPPFAVSVEELIQILSLKGLKLTHREIPAATIKPRKGREELLIMKKAG